MVQQSEASSSDVKGAKKCEHWPWQWNKEATECECGRYINLNWGAKGTRLSFDLIPQEKRADLQREAAMRDIFDAECRAVFGEE